MEESSVPRSTAIITLKPELLVGGRDTYVGSVSVRGHHVDDCPFPSFRIFSYLDFATLAVANPVSAIYKILYSSAFSWETDASCDSVRIVRQGRVSTRPSLNDQSFRTTTLLAS
jgi:hypothetical protein